MLLNQVMLSRSVKRAGSKSDIARLPFGNSTATTKLDKKTTTERNETQTQYVRSWYGQSTRMIPAEHLVLLLLHLCFSAAQAAAARGAGPPPRCLTSCAGVSVPYPFGVGDSRCYWPGFNLTCDRARGRLLIGDGGTLHVVEISLDSSTVRVMDSAGAVNITLQDIYGGNGTWGGGLGGGDGPYVVSERHSQLVVTGCNVQATLVGEGRDVISGCSSFCSMNKYRTDVKTYSDDGAACSGIGCCEAPIPIGRPAYGVRFRWLDEDHEYDRKLPIAVRVAERGWFDNASAALLDYSTIDSSPGTAVPVVLEFALDSKPVLTPGEATSACPEDAARSACRSSLSSCHNVSGNYRSGYMCRCDDGYHGNPYLAGGCQDIDECALPGMCSGECTNTAGGYICRCPRGARGNPRIKDGCIKPSLGEH
uniref:Uncharacterized protein n=1 Tax=Avena sativa TaxID=4498 RepID=A0ACD5ZSR3_AVESA